MNYFCSNIHLRGCSSSQWRQLDRLAQPIVSLVLVCRRRNTEHTLSIKDYDLAELRKVAGKLAMVSGGFLSTFVTIGFSWLMSDHEH